MNHLIINDNIVVTFYYNVLIFITIVDCTMYLSTFSFDPIIKSVRKLDIHAFHGKSALEHFLEGCALQMIIVLYCKTVTPNFYEEATFYWS